MSRSTFILLAKAAVTGALIFFLVRNVNVAEMLDSIRNVQPAWVVAALSVIVLQIYIAARRWQMVLNAMGNQQPRGEVTRIVWIGTFFNQTLPSTIGGDAIRIWELSRRRTSVADATSSVAIDRMVSLVAIVLVVVVSLPILFSMVGYGPAQISIALAAVGGLVAVAGAISLDYLPGMSKDWALLQWLAGFAKDARRVLLSPVIALRVLGTSMFIALLSGLGVALLARAFAIEVSLIACFVLVPPVLLVSAIPISLAGWGLREAAMITALAYVGVAEADALLVSICYGLILIVAGLPGGLLWLKTGRATPESETPAASGNS